MRNMCKYARFHTDSDTANIRRNKYLIASKGVAAAGVGGGVRLEGSPARTSANSTLVTRFRFRLAVRCCLFFALHSTFACDYLLLGVVFAPSTKNCNGFSAIVFLFKCVQPARSCANFALSNVRPSIVRKIKLSGKCLSL